MEQQFSKIVPPQSVPSNGINRVDPDPDPVPTIFIYYDPAPDPAPDNLTNQDPDPDPAPTDLPIMDPDLDSTSCTRLTPPSRKIQLERNLFKS